VSQLDEVLGGLLGGKGGSGGGGDLGSILSGLGGGGGGRSGGGAGMLAALLPLVGGLLANGGLQKMLSGFQGKGLSQQADSWVGTGENEAVSGQQVREVVGDDSVGEIAQQLGVSNDQAADALAEVLPKVVDHASPGGELPSQEELDAAFNRLQAAGG
jgi:uncharacterized protein YidB (DUF937 family)